MSRLPWEDLPAHVREGVEEQLGSPVVSAVTQVGGYSPGTAARLVTADGSRAFVKSVDSALNPDSPQLYRNEAATAAALPAGAPAPRLRWWHDDGDWVTLLFDDVEGREPAVPWQADELARVLAAFGELHTALTPTPVAAPAVVERYDSIMACWHRFAAAQTLPDALDDWSRRHLDRLVELETRWADGVGGNTLLHTDVRADNILLTDGGVVFVDWAHACTGAAWFDVAALAPSVAIQGGPDPITLFASCPSSYAAPTDAVLAVAAGLAGYFTYASLRPPPPGIPTVRAFQAAQGVAARRWVGELTGWT